MTAIHRAHTQGRSWACLPNHAPGAAFQCAVPWHMAYRPPGPNRAARCRGRRPLHPDLGRDHDRAQSPCRGTGGRRVRRSGRTARTRRRDRSAPQTMRPAVAALVGGRAGAPPERGRRARGQSRCLLPHPGGPLRGTCADRLATWPVAREECDVPWYVGTAPRWPRPRPRHSRLSPRPPDRRLPPRRAPSAARGSTAPSSSVR